MAPRADTYSRTVNTLKVLLPLAALALLSTLFFFSGEVDPTESIPYAELNVDQLVQEQQVSSPYFAGVTEDGTAVTLTGRAAIPSADNRDSFRMTDMDARFETAQSLTLSATAPIADVDNEAGTARLSGGTLITTSDGISIRTDTLLADLATSDVETLGPIAVEAPFGRVTANQMTMKRPNPSEEHVITFQGEVKLVYHSAQPEGDE
ncbi:MAG: LPS export ABC transporter periplasmic protein LptC [Pseudomonadota bacterium]